MCSGIEVMNPTPVDWRIPPSSSRAVTDLSDRIAERSPPAARQESPRLDRFWFHARARVPKTDLTRKLVWLPGTH
jgi:hypothetical protein